MAEIPPFDIHAPMDAPIRAREAREEAEHDKAMAYMRSAEFEALVRKAVNRPLKKDGTPDRRYGPRDDRGFQFDNSGEPAPAAVIPKEEGETHG